MTHTESNPASSAVVARPATCSNKSAGSNPEKLGSCTPNFVITPPVAPPQGRAAGCLSAGDREWADAVEGIAEPVFFHLQVIARLQVDPEPLRRAEETGQPQRRVRADATLAVHNL